MAQALIQINGVLGSDDDVPINTLLTLSNLGVGGEVSYVWSIEHQPDGVVDALSDPVVASPTITPLKQGTYRVLLTVNGDPLLTDSKLFAVRQVRSRERIPAYNEAAELGAEGWWPTLATQLQRLDALDADPGTWVGVAGAAGLLAGMIVKITGEETILTGLAAEATLPTVGIAPASNIDILKATLGVLVSGVDGDTTPAHHALVRIRRFGRVPGVLAGTDPVEATVLGAAIYVGDDGYPHAVAGTHTRMVGVQTSALGGGAYNMLLDGAPTFNQTYVDAAARAVDGGQSPTVLTASYAVLDGDGYQTLLVDATAGLVIVTLPTAAAPNIGRLLRVKKVDSTANVVLIVVGVGEYLDDAADGSYSLTAQGQSVEYQSAGLAHYVTAGTHLQWLPPAAVQDLSLALGKAAALSTDVRLGTEAGVTTPITAGKGTARKVQDLGAVITGTPAAVDAALFDVFGGTMSGATVLLPPANPTEGQRIVFNLKTAGFGLTWTTTDATTNFLFPGGVIPVPYTGTKLLDVYEFVYTKIGAADYRWLLYGWQAY